MASDKLSPQDISSLAERIALRVRRELDPQIMGGKPGNGGYDCSGDEFHCFNTYHECADDVSHSCANIYNET